MNQNFVVKRGMIFYMDVPSKDQPVPLPRERCVTKKRPYIILSNDACNANSDLVHAAPITTKAPAMMKWYLVPFRAKDSSFRWINISNTMLVPKSYCTVADYSESLSQVTFGNKELMDRLDYCIAKQFGFEYIFNKASNECVTPEDTSETNNNTVSFTSSNDGVSVSATNFPSNFPIPNISITINVPANITTQQPVTQVESSPEVSVTTPVEVTTEDTSSETSSKHTGKAPRFPADKIKHIRETIVRCSKAFNGNLNDRQLAELLGVSYVTITRYKKALKDPNYKRPNYYKPKKEHGPEIPQFEFNREYYHLAGHLVDRDFLIGFMTDYSVLGPQETYKKYSNIFKSPSEATRAFWSKITNLKKRLIKNY